MEEAEDDSVRKGGSFMEEREETVMKDNEEEIPIMQRIFDSIWFLAGLAIVFFVLSYIVWGMVDLLTIPMG